MTLIIIATWLRIIGSLFVVQAFSKLILTIYKMIGSAFTWLFILLCYMISAGTIALVIFREATILYSTKFYTFRFLFDAMLGEHEDYVQDEYQDFHSAFLQIHIFCGIFLLNYLVALLSTVYSDMEEMGDFAFKQNKYQYIERYMIAFRDEWGYNELIIHAPPLNLGISLLLPCLFKKDMMLRGAHAYSLVNFWLENLVFIGQQFAYELCLVPFIYIRTSWWGGRLVESFTYCTGCQSICTISSRYFATTKWTTIKLSKCWTRTLSKTK